MLDKHRSILNPGFVGNKTKKTTHSLTQSKSVAFGVFSFDQTALPKNLVAYHHAFELPSELSLQITLVGFILELSKKVTILVE